MTTERLQIEAAIRALEHQRPALGPVVVDAMLAGLHGKLAALAAADRPPPLQALKQVSIVFLDVVGSTTLGQHLDPEAIAAVMDDALVRGTAIVDAHGGRVLQYAGDNILAVFGAAEAREDDAERAVACGLALLALGRTLGAEVLAAHGHTGFNVRVGIHTGAVLLGGGVDAERTIRGIPVSIAARMEQTAPAGALRISQDTYAQVRGLFEVEAQPPLQVKGVDAPLQTWLVQRAKPRQFRIRTRGIEGVATRMVGRDAELATLQAAFARLFTERRLAAVTVVANAGIGKSRLLYEFEAWSETRPEAFCLFRGRATPQTGTQPFGLLRDLLAWRLQINDDDSVDTARRKMEDGIVPLFLHDDGPDLAQSHAHLLGHLIGIEWRDSRHIQGILDDARQIRNRALHAAAQLFRRVGARDGHPVVLQLEDLHWADDESLDFLRHLADVNRDVPMLVLAFTRPTLFERHDDGGLDGGTGGELHQRIDLQPLGLPDSRRLAAELLKKLPEVPDALQALLTSRAEGNPFFMEELVKMLIDQGAITTRSGTGDSWQVDAGRLLITQVPATLTGVMQARLDGLPAPEKHALQQASIVGAVFWDQALAAVDAQAPAQLPALVQRELALPRADAALAGLREYSFQHQLLHQVTLDTVLKRDQREGHARVAQWLADLTAQTAQTAQTTHGSLRAGDWLGLAAQHFELAGDTTQAVAFHTRAAEQAGARFGHERVLAHVGRALALLAESADDAATQAELRWRLLRTREQTYFLLAQRDEQGRDQQALAQLAEEMAQGSPDPQAADGRRAEVARRQSMRALRMGDWAATASAARYSMACAASGDAEPRLQAQRLLAAALMHQGDPTAGQALALQALAEARALQLRGVEARLLNTLANATGMLGDEPGALALNRQSLQAFRDVGDRVNEAICQYNLGGGWISLGALGAARQELDAARQLFRATGDRTLEGAALASLSTLALWQGDAAQARALALSAQAIAESTQGRYQAVLAGLRLGDAELALGQLAAARAAFAHALGLAQTIDTPEQHVASAGLARVALAEGDGSAAWAALQAVFDLIKTGGTLDSTEDGRRIELTCHQALAHAGDARAESWLARAHTALMTQAEAIGDAALRQGFLHDIPPHREIIVAWAQLAGQAGPGST
ncbi:MAG: AAA family ATPase [Rubrivivax sp.]|nr:AAA family ATPase [Rubrivivax sp.]